ncbi:uncharacterized protein [Dysidea avara]|uniref:uncharacterized protein n=1 Tax=Dysidea avara TaxID=196820 RepID=UPI003325558C
MLLIMVDSLKYKNTYRVVLMLIGWTLWDGLPYMQQVIREMWTLSHYYYRVELMYSLLIMIMKHQWMWLERKDIIMWYSCWSHTGCTNERKAHRLNIHENHLQVQILLQKWTNYWIIASVNPLVKHVNVLARALD